jgi:hypothetical protein
MAILILVSVVIVALALLAFFGYVGQRRSSLDSRTSHAGSGDSTPFIYSDGSSFADSSSDCGSSDGGGGCDGGGGGGE